MQAMVLEKVGEPLILKEIPIPSPQPHEVLIKVHACGVCRTDVHIVDGELPSPQLPLILGHQIVGDIYCLGTKVKKHKVGERAGVPWLGKSCHVCQYCQSDRENLCDEAIYTGYQQNGGYAQFCTAHEDFILKLSHDYDDLHTAPLLCAGLIGYRALKLIGNAQHIGFYGFGSSAHILIQVAKEQGRKIYVFTRPGDHQTQSFACHLGADWAGGSEQLPPESLDAAIIFAPLGALYIKALQAIKKGGKVISAGIHMSDIPSFPYALLWGERSISSVANLTRQDGIDFIDAIKSIKLQIAIKTYLLEDANQALTDIRNGNVCGSAVLKIE